MPTLCPRCRHTNDDEAHQCDACGERLAELCDGPKLTASTRRGPGRQAGGAAR